MTLNNHIAIFERLARQLVEGAFDRPFGQRRVVREIARQIATDIELTARQGGAANSYSIQLHPHTLDTLLAASPNLKAYLSEYLLVLQRCCYLFNLNSTGIKLLANQNSDRHQVLVHAEPNPYSRQLTVKGYRSSDKYDHSSIEAIDAFLIVDGKRHIKLRQPLITIGRHLESDIVLDDSSVSRQHAQLRWRNERFTVLDLGSKAGTLVNNLPIARQILQNGDVIRLGHAALIYGEEPAAEYQKPSLQNNSDGSTRQLPGRDSE